MGAQHNDFSVRFRRVARSEESQVSLDGAMLVVLLELDGERSVSEIAGRLHRSPEQVQAVLGRLQAAGLAEPAGAAPAHLTPEFLASLQLELARAVGPIAGVIVEDALSDLGHVAAAFPAERVAELVETVAREIPRAEARARFQEVMLAAMLDGRY